MDDMAIHGRGELIDRRSNATPYSQCTAVSMHSSKWLSLDAGNGIVLHGGTSPYLLRNYPDRRGPVRNTAKHNHPHRQKRYHNARTRSRLHPSRQQLELKRPIARRAGSPQPCGTAKMHGRIHSRSRFTRYRCSESCT
ncbi:hypothetical protein BJX66DRAFT_5131 [Aspergillus keveii]|uniref:Uncharacterized protein n=1 Tax=Aspergillus keveii TaxID=714993 RepID=A0ABR4GQS8_9EURO